MNTHLYELADTYKMIQDAEELTPEEITEALNTIGGLFNDKAINVAKLCLSLKADSEKVDSELKRLAQKKQAINNRVDGLKFYLQAQMEVAGMEKVKDAIVSVSLQKNQPSVQVDIEEQIPDVYWRVIPETKEVDKKAILTAYKESETIVPGVTIVTDKKHIVIR